MSDFDPAVFIKAMCRMGHNGMLGFAYDGHGPDWASLALPYRDDLIVQRAFWEILPGSPWPSLRGRTGRLAGNVRPQ